MTRKFEELEYMYLSVLCDSCRRRFDIYWDELSQQSYYNPFTKFPDALMEAVSECQSCKLRVLVALEALALERRQKEEKKWWQFWK